MPVILVVFSFNDGVLATESILESRSLAEKLGPLNAHPLKNFCICAPGFTRRMYDRSSKHLIPDHLKFWNENEFSVNKISDKFATSFALVG